MADIPLMSLKTTLGEGKLRLRRMSAAEELGRPFEFNVQALAEAGTAIDVAKLLGTKASVALELPGGAQRHFHGIVAAAGLDDGAGKMAGYRLILRPWLWLLTRRADNRFFLDKTAEEIIKLVFAPYTADFKFELSGTLPKYEYCAQYRETDFNFVSRLMEQEGLHYYFKHDAAKHTMHIVDKLSAALTYPGHEKIVFRQSLDASIGLEAITEWRTQHEIQPGKVTLTDFNFKTPSTSLLDKVTSTVAGTPELLDFYDQPGEYATQADGTRIAGIRRDELDARHQQISGACNVRGLACGHRFDLKDHPQAAQNAAYVATATRINLSHGGYESGQSQFDYSCRFGVVRADSTYRAQRLTPKPTVSGPQTAIVVGPSGDEIHTDEYGRVKVRFHWDRLTEGNETSSCWIRVASPWAGQGWGMIALPRIGQEVIVEFLEGDPDRPIITGRVYNAQQVTPYALPDNKTVSTIKSRSSPSGDAGTFNEFRFEDKKGSEEVFLQAQKDFIHNVKNDSHTHVHHDQSRLVGNNLTEQIGADYELKVAADFVQEVGGASHSVVATDAALDFGGAVATSIGGATALAVGAAADVAVGADLSIESGATFSLSASADTFIKSGANFAVDAGANLHIKAGANLVIEAGATLTLKGAMINIEGSGPVSIVGALVKINSGGGGGAGGGAKPKKPKKPDKPKKFSQISDAVSKAAEQHSKPRSGNG